MPRTKPAAKKTSARKEPVLTLASAVAKEKAKPTKRELEIQRFLKKRSYQRKREETDKRFPFTPEPHSDVPDYSKDAKRIRKALELDDVCFVPGADLFGMIEIMVLCAGHPLSEGVPYDTRFLYAIQRVHDWYHGRILPTDEEWKRVCKIQVAADYVREALNIIDEERKAGWPLREPRNHRRIRRAA